MKKYLIIFCLIFVINCFGQEKYVFDYYTVYDYQKNENEKVIQELTFSNSINSDYNLHACIVGDSIINGTLNDYKSNRHFRFKNFSVKEIDNGTMFNNSTFHNVNFDFCLKKPDSYYDVIYESSAEKKTIHIIKYKNKKKTKVLNESFYETEPTEITKLQHYNMIVLTNSLWCQRFNLDDNTGVITNAYFIEKRVKKNFWKLKEITKTDLTINVNIKKTE